MSKIEVNQISSQCGSTLTIGQSGDTIQLACGATQTGFGRTGTVNWDTTAKTASFTAVSGNGYFVNTTSGAITVTLPAGSAGDIVSLADYAATWQTNSVTVTPNGIDKIGGTSADVTLTTEGQSVTFVYTDSTQGWINVQDSTSNVRGSNFVAATGGTITTCGDYKIHTFTGPGTFCVSCVGNPCGSNTVDYLVVAGGGGGGRGECVGGGGGGAGGLRFSASTFTAPPASSPRAGTAITVPATGGYPVTVGGGGAGALDHTVRGVSGSNSTFAMASGITSTGGGGAGSKSSGVQSGANGGSGGGGAGNFPGSTGGSGNTPPVTPSQGFDGGDGRCGPWYAGGGGGGAAAAGQPAPAAGANNGGDGGAGLQVNIDTNTFYWAGGGGGSSWTCNPSTGGAGGIGGGGGGGQPGTNGSAGSGGGSAINPGANAINQVGGAGGTNSGGGGGGTNLPGVGGAGGSGIVIIRYKYQ